MNRDSRIVDLSAEIARNTTTVNEHLVANGLPQPSFDAGGPTDLILKSKDAEEARIAAISASIELQDLLQGPIACLRPAINATSLEAIYRYDIASKVPYDGEISFKDLAAKCNMYTPDLRRILRYAIVYHRVFQEPREGSIAHSAASRLLVDNSASTDTLGMMFDESWQAFARTCDAMKKFPNQELNETGYALAHNTNKTVWEYYAMNPTRGKRFANAMKYFGSGWGESVSFLVTGYSWALLSPGSTIVDVGGSEGLASIEIAKNHPRLNFIVQDLAGVVKNTHLGPDISESVTKRIRYLAHDFLTLQDVQGDVYLFRQIFHDWPDKYVVKILRNLIPALREGAKVVINERLMPAPGSVPIVTERQVRLFDLTMLSFFNSREREEGDWEGLFHEADSRFHHIRVWTPAGSSLAIIEAQWMP